MNRQAFEQRFRAKEAAIKRYYGGAVQTKIKALAVSWFRENYQNEQWLDGETWKRWKKPKRFNARGTTSQMYGTLMSKRDHLFRSIQGRTTPTGAIIYNHVPYAKIHNEGGDINQTIPITKKMRKWAWYMYYKTNGIKRGSRAKGKGAKGRMQSLMGNVRSNPMADKYKALALTKNTAIHRTVHMPKRPFLYGNKELARAIRDMMLEDIGKILK